MKRSLIRGIDLFDKIILGYPLITIICFLCMIAFFGYHCKDFKIDASAETLLNENDKDLLYWRTICKRYGVKDFIVITYKPYKIDLFSSQALSDIAKIGDEIKRRIKSVENVVSILNVPLIETAKKMNIKDLIHNIPTLETPGIDIRLAKEEFKSSPLYKNLLVSPELDATAIQVIFKDNKEYDELLDKRDKFVQKKYSVGLNKEEEREYKRLCKKIRALIDRMRDQRHKEIEEIRSIVKKYSNHAQIILGGLSVIADDLVRFIHNDLRVFGLGVFIFMVITLGFSFRKPRWVILPMLCCGFSVIVMMGILGLFDWEVTVISSNFISLQLILTMAIAIHLIVRYEEFHSEDPSIPNRTLIRNTIQDKFTPCLYTTLTTIAGFSSLLLCNIKPVRTFGWMMSAGLVVSLILTFIFFPAEVMLLKKTEPIQKKKADFGITRFFAKLVDGHKRSIVVISILIFILSAIGITRLEVENCFIDYFKDTTEIYRGLKFIDQKLGGTTPLDVILKFRQTSPPASDDVFEEFEEFESPEEKAEYWFTYDKIELIEKVHDYLDSLPQIGKVLSLATMIKLAKRLNNGKPLDNFELALLYKKLPQRFKDMIIKPFVSIENNEAHFTARIIDSDKSLRRNALLNRIKNDFVERLKLKKDQFRLAGILVLYNNILQSLFRSQILTLGFTAMLLMIMFLVLFRSVKISMLAIFPNILPVIFVLGFMGWVNIHLDLMTITIASISMGIAVDDTIHYIHRFEQEFKIHKNYLRTMYRCHDTIAYAMFYTTLVITVGFSILVFSNFIPTIYFGILTGLAMIIALVADLALLPALILIFKPFGPELEK